MSVIIKYYKMKIITAIVLSVLIMGCKKEDIYVTPTSQLLKKTWKLYSQDVITPLQGTALDGLSQNWFGPTYQDGCYTKMLWTYQDGNKLTISDEISCIPSGSTGMHYSTWTLSNKNKTITIAGAPFGDFVYSIISITDKKLVVQRQQIVGHANGGSIDLLIQYEYNAK